ncbi:hypothetical protein DVB88_12615 [Tsukamurella pulmonis]|nr:hypothetical protein DVB88_12615 [Tsukamurella pulmonis]
MERCIMNRKHAAAAALAAASILLAGCSTGGTETATPSSTFAAPPARPWTDRFIGPDRVRAAEAAERGNAFIWAEPNEWNTPCKVYLRSPAGGVFNLDPNAWGAPVESARTIEDGGDENLWGCVGTGKVLPHDAVSAPLPSPTPIPYVGADAARAAAAGHAYAWREVHSGYAVVRVEVSGGAVFSLPNVWLTEAESVPAGGVALVPNADPWAPVSTTAR